jgi:hypothetical protein
VLLAMLRILEFNSLSYCRIIKKFLPGAGGRGSGLIRAVCGNEAVIGWFDGDGGRADSSGQALLLKHVLQQLFLENVLLLHLQ